MFYGRQAELEVLEDLYGSSTFEFLVLYGRRRIGKTTLLSEFTKGKKVIFFAAQEENETLNLHSFSKIIHEFFDSGYQLPPFQDWNQAFSFLVKKTQEEKVLLVIDEFPYIAQSTPSILSILQHHIDHSFKNTNMKLILCGSSISFMEGEVLGYHSPIFGRRTRQIKLQPFNFYETCSMLHSCHKEDKIMYYAVFGGIPQYLEKIDPSLSFDDNIIRLFFQPSAYMYDEPLMMLKQELREPAVYNSIIKAISFGKNKMQEIADFTHEKSSKVSKYLANLIVLGVIEKKVSFQENPEKSKKGIYVISEHMFSFWYRFVFDNRYLIEQRRGKQVYMQEVKPLLQSFVGHKFEEVCREYLLQVQGEIGFPFLIQKIGSWWGNNTLEKRQEEIDVIGSNSQQLLLGECKWTESKVDKEVLDLLIKRSKLFPEYQSPFLFLFSKSGFSGYVLNYVAEQSCFLIDLDMLIEGKWMNKEI